MRDLFGPRTTRRTLLSALFGVALLALLVAATSPAEAASRSIPNEANASWAGYVVDSNNQKAGAFRASSEFTIPNIDCRRTPDAQGAIWAGLGGRRSDPNLAQAGVWLRCIKGVRYINSFWETVPGPKPILDLEHNFAPGDRVGVSVCGAPDSFPVGPLTTIQGSPCGFRGVPNPANRAYMLVTVIHGGSVHQWGSVVKLANTLTTAECIVERIQGKVGQQPLLVDFGSSTLTCGAMQDSISGGRAADLEHPQAGLSVTKDTSNRGNYLFGYFLGWGHPLTRVSPAVSSIPANGSIPVSHFSVDWLNAS